MQAELEGFEKHIGVSELSEKGQRVFVKGMESLLSVVNEIDMSGALRSINSMTA